MLVFPHFLNTGSCNSDPPPPKHDTTMTQHFGRFITIYQKRIQVYYLTSQNFEDLWRCITSAAGAGFGHVIALILFPSCVIWKPHSCADKHLRAGVTCSQPQATSHSRSDATNGYSAAPSSVIFTSVHFLGHGTVQSRESTPTFQRCVLPPSSGRWVMMEAVCTSVTSAYFYETTRSHIAEERETEVSHVLCCRHTQTFSWHSVVKRSMQQPIQVKRHSLPRLCCERGGHNSRHV
jgi:hypothetical protein